MAENAWLLIWLPLFGFLFNAFLGKRLGKGAVSVVASGSVGLAFVVAVLITLQLNGLPEHRAYAPLIPFTSPSHPWIDMAGLKIGFGLMLDPLSALMALIITGVGFLIHVYSVGYMKDDPEYARFFTYLNLFIVMMMLLVAGDNFLLMFVGWEGVGTCSYLLISFWYTEVENAKAGNKAFIVNRVGDLGFSLGMMTLWSIFGTLTYRTADGKGIFDVIMASANGKGLDATTLSLITLACFLLFVGAIGKSAQIPLWVWLPDAMAGPTPVSALIHAATMVTAGVVMLTRCSFLFVLAPDALQFVAWTGLATAFVGATVGLVQTDIKKVLAFSTVSQLGYMFLACGVGNFSAGMFHVTTHAFFKALLFLGAGAVIHSMLGEQDMRKMGGLKKRLPKTYLVMFIGTWAISGLLPLSGFWSKDEILHSASGDPQFGGIFYAVGLFTAVLTAFYMCRMMWKTFYSEPRFVEADLYAHAHGNYLDSPDPIQHSHADAHGTHAADETGHAAHEAHADGKIHESPASMMVPLYILAVFAALFGIAFGPSHAFEKFLEPSLAPASLSKLAVGHPLFNIYVGYGLSTVAAILGIGFAYAIYNSRRKTGEWFSEETKTKWEQRPYSPPAFLYDTFVSKWGFDAFYNFVFVKIGGVIANVLWKVIDNGIIDNLTGGLGYLAGGLGKIFRRAQTGYVRNYALVMLFGAVVLVAGMLATWSKLTN